MGAVDPVNQMPEPFGAELRTIVLFDIVTEEQQQKEMPPPASAAEFSATTQFLSAAWELRKWKAPPLSAAWLLMKKQSKKTGAVRSPHITAPPKLERPSVTVIAWIVALYPAGSATIAEEEAKAGVGITKAPPPKPPNSKARPMASQSITHVRGSRLFDESTISLFGKMMSRFPSPANRPAESRTVSPSAVASMAS